jgi:SrtB family sortase
VEQAEKVVRLLTEKSLQVATAESCTAGLLSAAITAVSGASAVFPCGITAYAPEIKEKILQVPTNILEQNGTVSAPTAIAMADGVRRLSSADIGVSITGVAGPSPSEGKPVGTVFIALANDTRVWVQQLSPTAESLSREQVREKAVETALLMMETYLQAYPVMTAGSFPLPPREKQVTIPTTPISVRKQFFQSIFPHKGDSAHQKWVKIIALFCSVAVLCLTGGGIFQLASVSGNQSLYDDLQNMYTEQEQTDPNENGILPRFSSLYSQNADIGGWIRIDGTNINYPVMKNAGSDYYANHNFRQQQSDYGVPFLDSKNTILSPQSHNQVTVIYGNNTEDGQMFSHLLKYRNAAFLRQHFSVEMSTLFSLDNWVIFGVMVLDPNEVNAFPFATTEFDNEIQFLQHISQIRRRSLLNTNVTVKPQDDLLVLVTQAESTYKFKDATMVVVARRLQENETIPYISVTQNETVVMPRIWVRMHLNETTTTTIHTTVTTLQTQTVTTTQETTTQTQETTTTDSTTTQQHTTQTSDTTTESTAISTSTTTVDIPSE